MSVRLVGSLISGAVLGKVLGFAREIEMARLLGANIIADSFRGAMTAVLLPVAPLQSDMLPSVLIPMYRLWHEEGNPAPRATGLALLLTLFATIVAVLVFALASPWVGLLVGGFDADAKAVTISFVRVMSLAIPASVLSATLSSIEIAVGTSRIAAIRASVQNFGLMIGIAVLAYTREPLAVPWSFVFAFNAIAAYGLFTLWKEGSLTVRGLTVGAVVRTGLVFWHRFRPLLVIPLVDQGNIVLERLLASGIAIGALASLDYARTLTETTFYLVSQPIGYVILTRAFGGTHTVRADVERISRRLLALGLPGSVFIAVFATDIVSVVFARGAFNEHAVALTAGALQGISIGLWAAMLGWVLVRMVNAAGRHGMAAVIIVSAYAGNALVNLAAVPLLGTFGLGFGEATRGLILLGGTAAALACGRLMLRCVGRAAIGAAVLGGVGVVICTTFDGHVARLAVAAPIFGVATLAWLAVCMPEVTRRVATALRNPRLAAAGGLNWPLKR